MVLKRETSDVIKQVMDFKRLLIENNEASDSEDGDDIDENICDEKQLQSLFSNTYELKTEEALTLDGDYILYLSCTTGSDTKICSGLSNFTCEIHNLTNSQLKKTATIDSHTNNIINVKFNSDGNLLYTGSVEGIKLWDLRTSTTESVIEFIDSSASSPNKQKPLTTFDVSANERLLCAGTELFEDDAFLLFWDIRNANLLGGYWESHTDDITKVLFHENNSNKLASCSTDGLINVFDLTHTCEDDALLTCLNTESSVEQILWYERNREDRICCVTHTTDVQLWNVEEATKDAHFSREYIAAEMKRKSAEHCYVANVHKTKTAGEIFLLTGSNWHRGECVRSLTISDNVNLQPNFRLTANKQRIRTSFFNPDTNLLITGGEQSILSVWQPTGTSNLTNNKNTLKNLNPKQKLHTKKPY